MNFSWKNGLIWIDISLEYNGINYQIENCIVDTGSAGTAIDIEQIEFDYNRPTQIKRLTGIGGTQEVMSQKIKSLHLDDTEVRNVSIEFGNLKNNYGINGFVGTDVLSKFKVTFDFLNQEIIFFKPTSDSF